MTRRLTRQHKRSAEFRSEFRRDRDRILYSGAFRRLAQITQVVSAEEGYAFHNRLTHVIKVAQVGRHLAEKLKEATSVEIIEAHGGLEPDVVEAAALAHDLGHPPFGHLAEHELQKATEVSHPDDGFEGNAQSFRVITKLEIRDANPDFSGLNLTCATLNAVLKYPKFQFEDDKTRNKKWGAYRTEAQDFDFAREGCPAQPGCQSLEAALMDWSDDIAYSVHDVDDFYRAGRIKAWRLNESQKEFGDFMQRVFERADVVSSRRSAYENIAENLFSSTCLANQFNNAREELGSLRAFTSDLIEEFEGATSIAEAGLVIDPDARAKVDILKSLIWHYVILDPAIATQQHGQKAIIRKLFEVFQEAAGSKKIQYFPPDFQRRLLEGAENPTRVAIDFIAGMTENQATRMFQRVTGGNGGAALIPAV